MKKRLLSICLALPVLTLVAGCDNSETPTAPNGGAKVDQKDVPAPKPAAPEAGKKTAAGIGDVKAP